VRSSTGQIRALQRIVLTGIDSMVIKATRTIPRAAIQEVAARATSPGRAVSRTALRSQNESKGQEFAGCGRMSDQPLAGQFQGEAPLRSISSDRFSALDPPQIAFVVPSGGSMAIRRSTRQGESA
jgi:hypothetical protein